MEGVTDFSDALLRVLAMKKENISHDATFLTQPIIRSSLKYVYPLFIFLHACVSVFGVGGNIAILVSIIKCRLYKNPIFFFIGNLALSDIIKAVVVSPITLANLLMQNFLFGNFMCLFLPMMHSFAIHSSMLTFTMIAVDRYQFIVYPMKSRVPAGLSTIAVWVVSVCVVLPYAVYIKYIDLSGFLGVDTVGMCMIDHDRHIEEYIRAMFVLFYCLPLAIIAFLYVKVSMELKSHEMTAVNIEETTQSVSEATYQSHLTWSSGDNDGRLDPDDPSISSTAQPCRSGSYEDGDLDMCKEKRTQKYMITMVTLFALCWLPITILLLVTHFVYEVDDNKDRYDIAYLTFTFFGYLSTCVNPVLFASWRMSDRTKNRLKGYFQSSTRRRDSGHSAMGRMSERSTCGMNNIEDPVRQDSSIAFDTNDVTSYTCAKPKDPKTPT